MYITAHGRVVADILITKCHHISEDDGSGTSVMTTSVMTISVMNISVIPDGHPGKNHFSDD